MPADMTALLDDLRAEHAALDELVEGADLDQPSAAAGWSVGDCVGHLWFFDREATRALVAPEEFAAGLADVLADPARFSARALEDPRALGASLPKHGRPQRRALLAALTAADLAN